MEPVIIAHFSKITDARYWIENRNKKVEELLIKQVPLAMKESERTPAYRGGSFLLQREQHYSSEELW